MRLGIKKTILTALVLALALSSCVQMPPQETPSDPDSSEGDPTPPLDQLPSDDHHEGQSFADSLFSVNYDPSGSMNPLTGTNLYNDQLFSLIYEGLFSLSPELEPEKVLCESFTVTEGVLYHIEIKSGVLFHDGSPLTPDDVVASLRAAKNSAKYAQRLSDVESVAISGDMSVEIRLSRPNYIFPALLDVPIMRAGQAGEKSPVGTGPYMLSGETLTVFTSHRDYTSGALRTIYLRRIEDSDLAEAFSERIIDLLDTDPSGSSPLNIYMVHEKRFYDTSRLVYLAFNTSSGVVSETPVRRALMRLVDRQTICADIYSGAARPSVFVISPALGLYDDAEASGYGYSWENFYRLANMAGLETSDADGYLDLNGSSFTLKLLVNSESPSKVAAARQIASDMESMGIRVTVESLPYDRYIKALEEGKFDMYLGEVMLRADLDMTALFSGALNYSKLSDPNYTTLMNEYLASDESGRAQAAYDLSVFVAEDAAIVPILYKQRSVLTHMGVVTGASPSQSGPFRGILSWGVDLKRSR